MKFLKVVFVLPNCLDTKQFGSIYLLFIFENDSAYLEDPREFGKPVYDRNKWSLKRVLVDRKCLLKRSFSTCLRFSSVFRR